MADGAHSTGLCCVLESATNLLGADYVFFVSAAIRMD